MDIAPLRCTFFGVRAYSWVFYLPYARQTARNHTLTISVNGAPAGLVAFIHGMFVLCALCMQFTTKSHMKLRTDFIPYLIIMKIKIMNILFHTTK